MAEASRRAAEQRDRAAMEDVKGLLAKHPDLVGKFCEIAERRVSIRDEYGEEDWQALPKQIDSLLKKLREREANLPEHLVPYLGPWERNSPFRDTYGARTRCLVEEIFREYHARQGTLPTSSFDCSRMTGVEFETYLERLLLEEGADEVNQTPKTGDQGVDLIVKRGGKRIAVQAKRYAGAVGNKAVQEVIAGMKFYGVDEG